MQENNEGKEEPMLDVKFLLKQVYAAHTSKVKELQTEVTKLKKELKEAKERILTDCPKCKQMELAYSACKEEYKNAVLEQTLRLKELEQKFAAIDRKAESMSNKSNKDGCCDFVPLPQNHVFDSIPESLKLTESCEIQDKEMNGCEPVKPLKYYNEIEKSIVGENKIPLLHIEKSYSSEKSICNLMKFSTESKLGRESVDNSLILVPETIDFVQNTLDTTGGRSPNKKSLSPRNKKCVGKENQNNEKDSSSPIKTGTSPIKSSRKRAFSEQIMNNESQDENEEKRFFRAITDTKETVLVSALPSTPTKNAKRKKFQKQKGFVENALTEGIDSSPKKIALLDDKIKLTTFVDDDDDFQSKYLPCEEPGIASWKSKIPSKKASLKTIKSSSRYKMTWDANNVAKKKIYYKQTKLSASTFHSNKTSNDSLHSADVCMLDSETTINEKNVEAEKARSNESSLAGLSELVSLIDADSTHTSPRHNQEVAASKSDTNLLSQKNLVLSQIETLSQKSIDDRKPAVIRSEIKEAFERRTKDKPNLDEENCEELEVPNEGKRENKRNVNMTVINLFESFDRVPVASNEPHYKYKEDAVRNKEKRQNLQGFECKDCEKYYNELGLTEDEKRDRMNYCSRHRAKHLPPSTPEHYWELDFPDTDECKLRGYIGNTQKVELKQRRRRPLNKD